MAVPGPAVASTVGCGGVPLQWGGVGYLGPLQRRARAGGEAAEVGEQPEVKML